MEPWHDARRCRSKALAGGYGPLTVFRDVNLDSGARAAPSACSAPNGSGKTTLLKTIVGSLPSSAGRVLLDGRDVTRLPAFRRARAGLSLVPEGRHILGTLTVLDNLALTRAVETPERELRAVRQAAGGCVRAVSALAGTRQPGSAHR